MQFNIIFKTIFEYIHKKFRFVHTCTNTFCKYRKKLLASPRVHLVPVSGQFEAAKLTHFSTAPLRTPTIPRFKRSLLTAFICTICAAISRTYYTVSLHAQRHESRSQLPVPQLFWLGAFEVF